MQQSGIGLLKLSLVKAKIAEENFSAGNNKHFAFFVICLNFLEKFCQEIRSECQTDWIQIRPDVLGPNLL